MKQIFLISSMLLISTFTVATTVRLETNLGNIDLEMREDAAPATVENFLNYVNDGDFDNSIFHRAIQGFIVQGGVFYVDNSQLIEIPADPSVINEFNISNTRGTVAMAKLSSNPNSATSSFFFNVTNNASILDTQNEGFTVFAEVVAGMDVVDQIGSLRTSSNDIPYQNYISGVIGLDNYVYLEKAFVLSDEFQINFGISGAWFNPATNGQGFYFEVLPGLDLLSLAWFAYDTEQPDETTPSTIGEAGNRWLTATGNYADNVFTGNLIATSGGLFDDSTPVSTDPVGTVTITFDDCSFAEMTYSLDSGLSNTIDIQRISGDNVDFCEQLAIDANQGVATQ